MTDLIWTPASALQETIAAHKPHTGTHGISLTELRDTALVQVMARRGKCAETAKAVKLVFGVAPPDRPGVAKSKNFTLIWSGPDQFLALSTVKDRHSNQDLNHHFGGLASLSDQSDGRVLVSVSGSRVRDMLAKICSLDLHPDVFPIGCAAITAIDHLSTNIWRGDDNSDGHTVFNLLLLSTFAVSLWALLMDASAEYGVKVETKTY